MLTHFRPSDAGRRPSGRLGFAAYAAGRIRGLGPPEVRRAARDKTNVRRYQLALAPVARTIGAHFAVSSLMKRPSSYGVEGVGSTPCLARLERTSGSARVSRMALASLSTTGRGRPLGPTSAYQLPTS